MKKTFRLFNILLCSALTLGMAAGFVSCKQSSDDDGGVSVTSVTITPAGPVTLAKGVTQQLTAAVLPSSVSQDVTWTTSDSSLVTVSDSGLVTAVANSGSAIIKAVSKADKNVYGRCIVNCNFVSLTSISIVQPTYLVVGGGTVTYSVTYLPINASNASVSWSSSDTNVVAIDPTTGVATAVAAGTATITATPADTTGSATAKTYSATVLPGTTLVKFNASTAAYTNNVLTNSTQKSFLLYNKTVDLVNDEMWLEARVNFSSLSGHNGVGFISVVGSTYQGYTLVTGQNIKNVGTTNASGGNGFDNGWSSWATGTDYVFKVHLGKESVNGVSTQVISYYVYDSTGTTLLGSKVGTSSTAYHAASDIVYPAFGGTAPANVTYKDIKVTVTEGTTTTTYGIKSLDEQTMLPTVSVGATTKYLALSGADTVSYTATQVGGSDAAITAVSSDTNIAAVSVDSANKVINITASSSNTGSAIVTVTNSTATYLTTTFTVVVQNYAGSDNYGSLTSAQLFPAPGATGVYEDRQLRLTFDSTPTINSTGTVAIYDSKGTLVDTIAAIDETQTMQSGNTINVGAQLIRQDGNNVYITPHFGKLAAGTKYYVAIPKNAITGTFNGATFDGFSNSSSVATWSFTVRAAYTPSSTTITVDNADSSTADYSSIYGAMKYAAAASSDYTINVAAGTYYEVSQIKGNGQTITLAGPSGNTRGDTCILEYVNNNDMNGSTAIRPVLYTSTINLVLKNITLVNLTKRNVQYITGKIPSSETQAESIYFGNGSGKTMAANNCSFKSYQDTIQTSGRNWFYNCYIEGDVDYIWGQADAALFEKCDLKTLYDSTRTSWTSCLLVARTGTQSATTVGKGYVILNSTVEVEAGMTQYFGRDAGSGDFWDQCAVVNTAFTADAASGTVSAGTISPTIWLGATYLYTDGTNIGWKDYNNTLGGSAIDTSGRLSGTKDIGSTLYTAEYATRDSILNRVYNKSTNAYEAAATTWDLTSLKSNFGVTD